MQGHKSLRWGGFILLVTVVMIPAAAYASSYTINTNDGIVDPNWGSVIPFGTDGDDITNDNYDLNQIWVTNEPDHSFYYFRANLAGSGQLPANASSIEAHLDCDQDGNDFGAEDVIVFYFGSGSKSVECQGTAWPVCAPGTGADWNAITTGEQITGSPNNYEWLADVNHGEVDWTTCLAGPVNIRFVTVDNSMAPQDSTAVKIYKGTTVVKVEEFAGSQPRDSLLYAALLLGGIAIAGSAGYAWGLGRGRWG